MFLFSNDVPWFIKISAIIFDMYSAVYHIGINFTAVFNHHKFHIKFTVYFWGLPSIPLWPLDIIRSHEMPTKPPG